MYTTRNNEVMTLVSRTVTGICSQYLHVLSKTQIADTSIKIIVSQDEAIKYIAILIFFFCSKSCSADCIHFLLFFSHSVYYFIERRVLASKSPCLTSVFGLTVVGYCRNTAVQYGLLVRVPAPISGFKGLYTNGNAVMNVIIHFNHRSLEIRCTCQIL